MVPMQGRDQEMHKLRIGPHHSRHEMQPEKRHYQRKKISRTRRNQDDFFETTRASTTIQTIKKQRIPPQPTISKEELDQLTPPYKTQDNPEKYSEELNKVLVTNNLPKTVIPEDSALNTEVPETPSQNLTSTDKENSNGTLERRDTKEHATEAKQIGVNFYTTKERGMT